MNIPAWLHMIDLLFVVFVLLFAVNGLRRGFSGELASLLALLVLWGGFHFLFPFWSSFFFRHGSDQAFKIIQICVGLVFLLITIFLFAWIRRGVRRLLEKVARGFMNRVMDVAFGALRGLLIGVGIMVMLSLWSSEKIETALTERSVIGNWVCNTFTPWLTPRLTKFSISERSEDETF